MKWYSFRFSFLLFRHRQDSKQDSKKTRASTLNHPHLRNGKILSATLYFKRSALSSFASPSASRCASEALNALQAPLAQQGTEAMGHELNPFFCPRCWGATCKASRSVQIPRPTRLEMEESSAPTPKAAKRQSWHKSALSLGGRRSGSGQRLRFLKARRL